jgi:2-succinyl-5-enolpyruvyl-6-hydroxy-3-cyclohexene-1-carboxylate synthase
MSTGSVWGDEWREADARVVAALSDHVAGGGGHDGVRTVHAMLEAAALGAHVVVASSMAIRHLDRQTGRREDLVWFANRGATGIDGTVSTALGVAVASAATSRTPVIAIVGDVALLHDTNAWLLAADTEAVDLSVVVLDDDGGTIFDLLPPGAFPSQRRLFATPHGRDIADLAALHRLDYARLDASRHDTLDADLAAILGATGGTGRRLLHVRVRPLARDVAEASREVVAEGLRGLPDRS